MKRIIRNIIGVLLLTMAMVVTQIPVEVTEASNEVEDFQMDGTTLVKYTGTASTVSVPSTVEKIGEEAFAGNAYIESVKLPKKVEMISFGAFSQCRNLKKVNLPESITTIETGAFANCESLGSVKLGGKVRQLGNGVFAGCTNLKKVSVDKDNTSFICEKGVLFDKEKKTLYQYLPGKAETSYTIPNSVENIKEYAFWGSSNLEKVQINPHLSRIPSYAFSNCKALEDVFISYAVKAIDSKAFEDCVALESLMIPPSVGTIHDSAFDGCYNLTLSAEKGTKAEAYAITFNQREKTQQAEYEDIWGDSSEGNKIQQDETVSGNSGQSSEEGNLIGSSKVVGNQAFVFIDNSSAYVKDGSASINPNPQKEVVINGSQSELSEDQDVNMGSREKGMNIPKYTITDDGMIADQSFYRKKDLTEYTIPEGTKSIGEFAFARTALTGITIPEGVTTIGYGAFYHCENLNQVTFPSTITKIEPHAFEKTGFIENWKKSGSTPFLTVGDGVLIAYQGTDSAVNIPDGVKIIAPGVFKDNKEISKLFLPDSVVTIGEGAFENCSNLSAVAGGTYLKSIEDRAFAGCPITTVRITDTVENIGLRAYDYSGLDLSNDELVAVFHGNIPKLSYELTAQRLSNKEYREIAFKEVPFAVINQEISLEALEGTILDSKIKGFKGIIVSLDESARTATVRGTTLTGEELAYFEVPATIEVYERQYELQGISELDKMAKENTSVTYDNIGSVLIKNKVKDLEVNQMSADFSGEEGAYFLSISENPQGAERLNSAYQSIYQNQLPSNLKVYDLSFYEESNEILINKLGKEYVQVTMPLPESLLTGNLRILTTDGNGQLEEIPCERNADGGSVSFRVNHFSDFGFYTTGQSIYGEGSVKNGKASIAAFELKDESPETGDSSIHPKWFFAVGLLCTACAVVFYRKKEKLY